MKNFGISVYTSNDWGWSYPQIYSNLSWETSVPYIYTNGNWKVIGAAGTNMIRFYTSDGKEFYDSNGDLFLVRDEMPILQSISVTTMPTKTSYIMDIEYFDPTGMIVTGTYSYKGTIITRPINTIYFSNDPITYDNVPFVIQCFEHNTWFTTSINLNVINTFYSLTITKPPNKTNYAPNDIFDPTGMVVKANFAYNNRIYKSITVTGYSFSPSTNLTKADTIITISYTYHGVTKTCQQAITFGLEFNYTGNYSLEGDPAGDWVLYLLTTGTLTIHYAENVDFHAVGGGGGGSGYTAYFYIGLTGGGGYTTTIKNQALSTNTYYCKIGNGGAANTNGEASYIKTNNNNGTIIINANGGGAATTNGMTGAGGSGGSAGISKSYGFSSMGPVSAQGYSDGNPATGDPHGQGRTTRDFEEPNGVMRAKGGDIGEGSETPRVNYGDGGTTNDAGSCGILIIRNSR